MLSKAAGDQCSKPAGTGSSDLTAKKGIAIREISHSLFISHHLETTSGFPLGTGILIWLRPQNNKNRGALLEKAPRRFFLRLGSEENFHCQLGDTRIPGLAGTESAESSVAIELVEGTDLVSAVDGTAAGAFRRSVKLKYLESWTSQLEVFGRRSTFLPTLPKVEKIAGLLQVVAGGVHPVVIL